MVEPIIDAIFDIGVQIAVMVIAAAGVWIVAKAQQALTVIEARTGVQIDEARRQALEAALTNAIARAETRVGEVTIDEVIEYLRTFNPQTLAHFNLTRADLVERVTAAIATRRKEPIPPPPTML